jgi:hypothetical protein
MGQIADGVKRSFIRRFARNTTTGAIGRVMPFGIGAVIGGTGNHLLGRKVVASSREAFGPAPLTFPLNLEAGVRVLRVRDDGAQVGRIAKIRGRLTRR